MAHPPASARSVPIPHDLALPTLRRRQVDSERHAEAVALGLPDVVARVLAGRQLCASLPLKEFLVGRLASLDDPEALKDIGKSAERLVKALEAGESIGLLSDYDQDGLGAMAVLRLAFVQIFVRDR